MPTIAYGEAKGPATYPARPSITVGVAEAGKVGVTREPVPGVEEAGLLVTRDARNAITRKSTGLGERLPEGAEADDAPTPRVMVPAPPIRVAKLRAGRGPRPIPAPRGRERVTLGVRRPVP